MFKKLFLSVLSFMFMVSFAVAGGKTINGAGATFPYPVYSAWAYMYYKTTGIKLNYQSIGSGGGVRQIKNRTVDFGASDAPLTPEKLEEYKLYQFPAIIGGVVLIVNIKGVKSGQLKISREVLADIFLGKIKKWNAPEIQKLNPGLKLPDAGITVIHRSDGSGTTAIFTKFLSTVSKEWQEKVGDGKSVNWPVGIGGKGNEGVANYVKRVRNSIGYVEFAYAKNNKLTYVLLENREGNFVIPSFESFKAAAAFANWDKDKGFYLWLVDAPGKESWPIAGASFILLAKEKTESNKKVVQFYDWTFKKGDEVAKRLIYVPLPENLKSSIRAYWKEIGIY
ncbi:phosphate ABC transporter substrate-binding protein PstS [Deferribacter autotrophicus]|uniref:Phosphate-binding protein n=1 Tax=Deferribacter autotrophicus TaxID=500465 RepID=A0A5A8F5A5_9BACT|nr:phosphate ABC transporter substrate-binding protein PstS [Deferribacter autotrophicus]KAA0258870.1 phosphate ABC transporter substrate-binding protein PstS [Deferribacter autotrophicus]